MIPLKQIAIAAFCFLAGCSQEKAVDDDNAPLMVDGDHTHYHVHGAEIKHDHNHESTKSTAHTHEHLHDRESR